VEAWSQVLKQNNPALLQAIGSRFAGMVQGEIDTGNAVLIGAVGAGTGILESLFLAGVHMGAHLEQLPR